MAHLKERFGFFFHNRWLVFVVAMWIQTFAGIGYLFGSISPIIKSSLNYNQKQIARLGVAKDLGDSVGFLAGTLCEILPLWAALLVGAIQNFIGYGWVWLIVTGRTLPLPLWAVSILLLFSLERISCCFSLSAHFICNFLLSVGCCIYSMFVNGRQLWSVLHDMHWIYRVVTKSGVIKSKNLLCQINSNFLCGILAFSKRLLLHQLSKEYYLSILLHL